MFFVSQSKVKTWRTCRRKYHYKYVEKLVKKRVKRPLQFGRIIHSMIETYADGDDPFVWLKQFEKENAKMLRLEREEYGEIIDDARVIMTEYFNHYDEGSLAYLRKKGKASEHDFAVEIDKDITIKGRMDAFASTKNKLKWLTEHKTFGQMPSEDDRWKSLQSAIYLRVNDMLGWFKVDGMCWNYIWSKPPSMPKITKTGKISEAALVTLPTRVYEFLEEQKAKKKDFKKLIEEAEMNRTKYFQRIFLPKKKKVIDTFMDEFIETAREMSDLHGKSKTRTIDRHCLWCDYKDLCRAELTGSDADFLRKKEYKVEERQVEIDTDAA